MKKKTTNKPKLDKEQVKALKNEKFTKLKSNELVKK